MAYVRLVRLDRCASDGGTFVQCAGRELAVFRLSDPPRAVVIDNSCPHASGNLSGGRVNGTTVTCLWHQWEFDLQSGECVAPSRARITRYPVEVRDGYVYADLSAPL